MGEKVIYLLRYSALAKAIRRIGVQGFLMPPDDRGALARWKEALLGGKEANLSVPVLGVICSKDREVFLYALLNFILI